MKLKRLVSAILAVGMALTMLPTAAFAADKPTYVNHLSFIGDQPDTKGKNAVNGMIIVDHAYNWSWSGSDASSYKLNFTATFDPNEVNAEVPNTIPCEVRNQAGIIKDGIFQKCVYNFSTIENGQFESIDARSSGIVKGGYIKNYTSTVSDNTEFENGIVYGSFEMTKGTLTGGLICQLPDNFTSTTYQYLKAPGCSIIPVIPNLPEDVVFNESVYMVGKNQPHTFKVIATSKTFRNWNYDESLSPYIIKIDDKTLQVTVPDTGNIYIEAAVDKVPLSENTIGLVDGKIVPVDKDGELYSGSEYDGWIYNSNTNTLTIKEKCDDGTDSIVDLGNTEVDWNIKNFGIINGGIFISENPSEGTLRNEETGKIEGGKFNTSVRNFGTIDDGIFNFSVSNYGTVNNGTFTDRYSNASVSKTNPDNTVTKNYGFTNGGIFSRYASFDNQPDIKLSWVTLNNCTANGISGLVGVVGNQTLNVEADATSWTGWEVTADPSYEEAITKQVGNTTAFDLTLNGDDEWSVTLTAQVKEGYYRMSLTDGTATNADGTEITSAKAGDTVKLTAADAPEGMVFDRWEISPADVALTLEEVGFDSHAATASFKMPAQTLSIRAMYRMADQPEEPNVLGTVAMVATAGVGAAVVGYTGYMIGTELYLNTVLPDGVAIPQNTAELAKLVWTEAGKPAPAAVMAPDATDEQKALTWAIENQLISADKAADASVSRWEVIQTWNKAQEMKG